MRDERCPSLNSEHVVQGNGACYTVASLHHFLQSSWILCQHFPERGWAGGEVPQRNGQGKRCLLLPSHVSDVNVLQIFLLLILSLVTLSFSFSVSLQLSLNLNDVLTKLEEQ